MTFPKPTRVANVPAPAQVKIYFVNGTETTLHNVTKSENIQTAIAFEIGDSQEQYVVSFRNILFFHITDDKSPTAGLRKNTLDI